MSLLEADEEGEARTVPSTGTHRCRVSQAGAGPARLRGRAEPVSPEPNGRLERAGEVRGTLQGEISL